MNASRTTAALAGALFLIAMVSSLLGGGLIEAAIGAPNPLAAVAEHTGQVTIGVLLELVNAIAVIGIASLLFPILRRHQEQLARAYLGLRIVEAVFCCVIVIGPLALIALSRQHATAGAPATTSIEAAVALAVAERAGVASLLIPLFFSLGALLFYTVLYQARILPRTLSIWGLIATTLILLYTLVGLYVEIGLGLTLVFVLPIIVNEITLGVWLIVRGFSPAASAPAVALRGV